MYKACIFDLDGTLIDTLESLTFSVNETLKEVALPAITEEQCRTFVGNGAKVLIEQSLKAAGDTKLLLFEKAFEAYGRIFDRNCTYHVKPYPGIREMLLKLKDQNMKLGVLSNKPDRQAVHVVEEIFGKETFDLVWGQREGVPRKPDPSALFVMAESLGVSSEEVLYIGDSEVDAATGNAADMDTVLVEWGFRSREELEKADAYRIVAAADEILDIIR